MGLVDVARGVVLDGRYRVEEILGQGGMATVYRAHDEVLGRDVAVKLFPPTPDADEVLRHQAEMRVLARLSHPGLVTLHDAGSAYAGGPMHQTYLVMELVRGPTLADRLVAGRFPATHVARAGRQLAEALATVHDAGVVHRDIKPANVLMVEAEEPEDESADAAVTTGPIVKLADFGIARFADGARLTMTGTTLGTATYLAPEQAAGAEVGPAADVYALGLVLLECLTGRRAFTGTVVEVAAARLTTSPQVPGELGSEWVSLLESMTARRPEDRPSMSAVAVALTALLGESTGELSLVSADLDSTRAHPAPTEGPAASEEPRPAVLRPAGPTRRPEPATETRPLRTGDVVAAQMRRTREAGGPGALEPGEERVDPPARWTAAHTLLAALGIVVLLGIGMLLSRSTTSTPEPPTYPAVEGSLGDALDDLAASVSP
ncbi:serine/threonine protein kinase [Actinotalea sp. BY-33]|uniref:non-specific serine/threonine protein kinase n=1 Tax=Actinotalea soli TaxID=2819234 RepID=A0A939LMK8_9CELL|nr:serine/threonine-protein kinase [Actinotalea soli]MBO1750321.1 serine/threonine protein kinase [Actinotalea soli]